MPDVLSLIRSFVLGSVCLSFACGTSGNDVGNDGGEDISSSDAASAHQLDILFVMREGGDLRRLRGELALALPGMAARWQREIPDLHVAVVGTDLGVRDSVGLHRCSRRGTEGELRSEQNGCAVPPESQPFLSGAMPEFAQSLSCLIDGPEGECGMQRPLEASLMALSGVSESYRFWGDSRFEGEVGNGDNDGGFRRKGVPLVLIMISKRDDCSFIAGDFLEDSSPDWFLHCATEEEGLFAPELYADAWTELAPAGVHVFVMGGVPTDLIDRSISAMLLDPRMVPHAIDGRLAPSCRSEHLGGLSAPRRLLQVAEALNSRPENSAVVASACDLASVDAAWVALEQFVLDAAH